LAPKSFTESYLIKRNYVYGYFYSRQTFVRQGVWKCWPYTPLRVRSPWNCSQIAREAFASGSPFKHSSDQLRKRAHMELVHYAGAIRCSSQNVAYPPYASSLLCLGSVHLHATATPPKNVMNSRRPIPYVRMADSLRLMRPCPGVDNGAALPVARRANYWAIDSLLGYLIDECCADAGSAKILASKWNSASLIP
jgi:hypothetical protein